MHTALAENQSTDTIAYFLHGNCYLNITQRCTLSCRFCPKFNGSWDVQQYHLKLHHEPSVMEIMNAVGDPKMYKEIVFCGLGEPTLRLEVLLRVAEKIKVRGGRVRINTDGLANLVYQCDITPRFSGIVDSISISLNAQNARLYRRHCRPKHRHAYKAMLDFTRKAREVVPHVTVTAIDGLAGVNIAACKQQAEELGVDFRRRVLDQVG